MAKTALATSHAQLGGQTIDQQGWEMYAQYGDLAQEYQAVRKHAGLIDLSNRGRIEVSGKNRTQFLQGLVSNDVKTLQPGHGVFAAFLTAHGRILSDCFIYAIGETFVIDTPPVTREKIFKSLEKFSPAGEFNVTDLTEATSLLTIQGPQAKQILAGQGAGGVINLSENQLMESEVANRKLIVIKHSRTGEEGFDLLISNEKIAPIFDALIGAGAKPVGLSALNTLRLEAGLPEYGQDMDENIILLEAGLERAVSYTKGCYVGQETIAKIHHRGKNQTAKRLAGLLIQGSDIPPVGAKIYNKDNKEVGHITSAVQSLALNQLIAFAYLRRDNFTPGLQHTIDLAGTRVSAEVAELPFYPKKSV